MYLYLLNNKNEALDALKVFKYEVEKQYGNHIKTTSTNRVREYCGRWSRIGLESRAKG